MLKRRQLLTKAGIAGAAATTTLAAPPVIAQEPIRWRMQTYAGATLGQYVTQPFVDAFTLPLPLRRMF